MKSQNTKGRLAVKHTAQDREEQVSQAMILAIPSLHLDPSLPVLIVDDTSHNLKKHLVAQGFKEVHTWSRYCDGLTKGTPSPPHEAAPFQAIFMRLPRAKQVLLMQAHILSALLTPEQGKLVVYGANDEGIKSTAKKLSDIFAHTSTVDSRRHCRVIQARKALPTIAHKTELQHWLEEQPHPLTDLITSLPKDSTWHHYPGLFAKGKLDDATALLLTHLPSINPGDSVLDFAAGGGVISAFISIAYQGITTHMLEVDSIALLAAKHNVPGATTYLSDSWNHVPKGLKVDHILSNPPIHKGKSEDFSVLHELVHRAPDYLNPGGSLTLVVQSQVPTQDIFDQSPHQSWKDIKLLADDRRFKIWHATT